MIRTKVKADTEVANGTVSAIVMRARGITKHYGATHALKGVDFTIKRGQVTVLFGENGAGKSTLMKIMSGIESPTSGTLELDGEEISLKNTIDASQQGISIIHQELNLCANLSISDNIFIGRDITGRGGTIDRASESEAAGAVLKHLEEDLSPDTLVADLRLGQQQIVEIARALASEARVLIMDEPTSALSGNEVVVLFRVIRELKAAGVAIVYISHHLEEALEIADRVVVFRDGALVAEADRADVDLNWVITRMVGRAADDLKFELREDYGDVALSLRDIKIVDQMNTSRLAVDGLDLDVRAGEMVCLYGLMGAGRTELLEALAGRLPIVNGSVTVLGRSVVDETVGDRIDLGMTLVPEDRQRDGLIPSLSVGGNIALSSLKAFVKGFWLRKRQMTDAVNNGIRDVTVKTESEAASIDSLSGGNQQKVVLARVLLTTPHVLLLDEPTRGIDVGAKAEIYTLMTREARRGLAVLFATSEVGEALNAANRVVVMSKGQIVGEFDPRKTTREQLMVASGETAARGKAGAR
ncbi:MAG: sugar ABC transporter ATP-binding protein [Demequinaceae bacterium]|nr:sugar ABC transporter ATP-binding protein [Demequinaceae bacterium]